MLPASASATSSSPTSHTSNAPPTNPNPHRPLSTPLRPMFPGFLASSSSSPGNNIYSPTSPASASSSRSASPHSTLPYLRNEPGPSSSPVRKPPSPHRSFSAKGSPKVPSPLPKRRPSPLELGKTPKSSAGLDEKSRLEDGVQSGRTEVDDDGASTLSTEMQDLSLLRQHVKRNLLARPVDSPLAASSDSGDSSGPLTPATHHRRQSSSHRSHHSNSLSHAHDPSAIPINDVLQLLRKAAQPLIIDTRPLGTFLESHLPRSVNISIPSLIFKRFRKASTMSSNGKAATTWDALAGFVSTQAGRSVWESIEPSQRVDVVVVGLTVADELAKLLQSVMDGLVDKEKGSTVRTLKKGWVAVLDTSEASAQLVSGEMSRPLSSASHHDNDTASPFSPAAGVPLPKSAPTEAFPDPASSPQRHPTDPASSASPPRVGHHPSMPSLRHETKRALPSLSLKTSNNPSGAHRNRPPKLSLNLDKPLKSATIGSFPLSPSHPPLPAGPDPHFLSVGRAGPSRTAKSPGLSLSVPKSPMGASFQTLCHAQSKLPPSPSSFGGVIHRAQGSGMGNDEDYVPGTPWSNSTARPAHSTHPSSYPTPSHLDPTTPYTSTARPGLTPFIVSTILPSFLYLGPEITSEQDVEELKQLGVKRILNVAIECDDDEGLRLRDNFEKYLRVPMRDIVEESGVGKGMRDACEFLDDARLHSAPTYVHCKAGKSRSVTVVLAYLIHANAWTLKTSYAYVAERRKGISPNIGFVAELMQFEEAELGLRQSGGVRGTPGTADTPDGESGEDRQLGGPGGGAAEGGAKKGRANPRYMRESLPPAWGSLDAARPGKVALGEAGRDEGAGENEPGRDHEGRKAVGDEREVRKNGQWVHHRRAPVDRTTLQPGRRVSKAGLESLRPLNTGSASSSPVPSPKPSEKEGKRDAATPSHEGRLGWV